MNPLATLIACVIAAVVGAGGAWRWQESRIDELKLEQANERISQQRAARAALERSASQVIQAQNAAAHRAVVLRQSADAGRVAVDGLRQSTDNAVRDAQASPDACLDRAAAIAGLLNTMAAAGGELAGKAGRHVNDIQTLTEAWAK